MSQWERLGVIVARHRIVYGVALALIIAILLTMVSMALYVSSGASRLDLSRPGYEQVRQEVQRDAREERFSSNGPVDAEALNDFRARFSSHRETMKKLDSFGSSALDDAQLQIAPSTQ